MPPRGIAVVIGQASIERGLVVYPGAVQPDELPDWRPGGSPPLPAGTLLLWLDLPEQVPAEFTAKAARYAWPDDSDLVPVPLSIAADGPADVDRRSAQHLTLAIAGVLAHDRRQPTPGVAPRKTTGKLLLTGGHPGTYTIG